MSFTQDLEKTKKSYTEKVIQMRKNYLKKETDEVLKPITEKYIKEAILCHASIGGSNVVLSSYSTTNYPEVCDNMKNSLSQLKQLIEPDLANKLFYESKGESVKFMGQYLSSDKMKCKIYAKW